MTPLMAAHNVNRTTVTLAIMLSAIMVLLDMTIANVSLPHMMGSLGVTSEQITWVLTAYTMAEAIFIPLASYLTLRFGERNLLLISIAGFVTTSALCGQADSLAEMITFRILQGAFGASVIPLAQSILVQIYPKEERGKAMALFSVGILLGPILGPTVGGIITEHLDWRWIFYVNLPVGILCLGLLWRYVHINNRGATRVDWLLVVNMAIGIGLLQMVLSRGNEENWFSSNLILFASIISAITLLLFIIRSVMTRGDIAPIWLLKDRNLAASCLIMSCFALGMFGITQLQPMMLEQLLNYPVETTGFVMAPRGLASAVVLLSIARIMDQLDGRMLVVIGLLLNALGTWLMTHYSLNIDLFWIIFPSLIQGAGMGLVFAPLSQMAFMTLNPQQATGGAVVYNLCRTIGSSFGIAIVNTYFSRVQQSEWHSLGGALSPDNITLQQYAAEQNTSLVNPDFMASIAHMLQQQSSLLAFVYTFVFIMVTYLVLIPLVLMFRKTPVSPVPQNT